MIDALEEKCTLCGTELEGEGECMYGDICTECENDILTKNIEEYAGLGEEQKCE